MSVVKEVVLTKVSVLVKAIDTGYYKGLVIKAGQKFKYEGVLKDGKFPIWVEKPLDFKMPKVEVKKEEVKKPEVVVSDSNLV